MIHDPEVKETWDRNLTERLPKRANENKTHIIDFSEISGLNEKALMSKSCRIRQRVVQKSKTNGTVFRTASFGVVSRSFYGVPTISSQKKARKA